MAMREFGWTYPILVDEHDRIIAGHGRLAPAELNRAELAGDPRWSAAEVPVIVARGWTAAQKRAYALADNQLALNAGWDETILRLEIKDLELGGFDLSLIGFDGDALDGILHPPVAGEADPDQVPDLPANPATRRGDVWLMGCHRLLCGDATDKADVGRLCGSVRPRLMVTDPPYGVNYDPSWRTRAGVNLNPTKLGLVANDDRADWTPAWLLFRGDVAYVWHGGLHAGEVEASLKAAGFAVRAQIVWVKDRFALSRGDYHWQHEPCWYVVRDGKPGGWTGDRSQSTTWAIPAREDSGHGHGTQKPVECMARAMRNNGKPGKAVYDPFVGSGTSIIAAEMVGQCCLAIDVEPRYCDVAVQRWQTFTGGQATLEGDGRSFAEVALERLAAGEPGREAEGLHTEAVA